MHTLLFEVCTAATMADRPRTALFKYTTLFWVGFIFVSFLFIVDRMTINVFPRQRFSSLGYKTGSDSDFAKSPWSWQLNQAISRISGRYTMVALNALFFTSMHSLHERLASSALNRFVDFTDETARLAIHRKVGISICFVTILHVWGILFPAIFQEHTVGISVGTFTWPLSERAPSGLNSRIAETKHVYMQVDDVYRLVLMTIFLGPVIYFSVKRLASNYRFGIRLHQFVMVMYFIDIIRRHSHPHSWFLNIPMFVLWLLDKIAGFWYRQQTVNVRKIILSENCMLLHWKYKAGQSKEATNSIGAIVRMSGFGCSDRGRSLCTLEPSHPFTSFCRRTMILQSISNTEWDCAIIVRAYNKSGSYTRKVMETRFADFDIRGPFPRFAIPDLLNSGLDLLLIGGGSGSGFLIDTLIYISCQTPKIKFGKIKLVFTSRDVELVRFWISIVSDIYQQKPLLEGMVRLKIVFTGKNNSISTIRVKDVDMGTHISTGMNMGGGTGMGKNGVREMGIVTDIGMGMNKNNVKGMGKNIGTSMVMGTGTDMGTIYTDMDECMGFSTDQTQNQVTVMEQTGTTFPWGIVQTKRCDINAEAESLKKGCAEGKIGHVLCHGSKRLQISARTSARKHGLVYHESHVSDDGQARAADSALEEARCITSQRAQRRMERLAKKTPPSWFRHEDGGFNNIYFHNNPYFDDLP